MEWVVVDAKILIVTHDQLLEERPEKICMYVSIYTGIHIGNEKEFCEY